MPKIPVDECPASPAMDAAVARALGLKVDWSEQPDGRKVAIYLGGEIDSKDGYGRWIGWRPNWCIVAQYSTDIAAAWGLLPKMQSAYGILLGILHDVTECKIMKNNKPIIGRAEGEAIKRDAHAICRAFLKANGVEEIEVP